MSPHRNPTVLNGIASLWLWSTVSFVGHSPLDFWSWAPEPTVPPNPLDQTYLHKRLHTMIGPTTVLLAAKALFYLVLAAHVLHYRALTRRRKGGGRGCKGREKGLRKG